MLSNMLNDIGITEEIFAEACIKSTTNPTHKMLLSEIMAVDNFIAFKKLMLKRNRELNEEAMQLMAAQEAGIDPSSLYQDKFGGASSEDAEIARAIQASLEMGTVPTSAPTPVPTSTPAPTVEDEMIRQALEASKKEYEAAEAAKKAEETKVAKKEEKPKPKKEKIVKEKPAAKKEEIAKVETTEAPKPVAKAAEPVLAPIKAPKTLAPIGAASASRPAPVAFDIKKHAEETKKREEEKKTMSKEEMKERMEKLRKQRDILLKRKQEALQKEWNEYGDDDKEGGDSRKDMIQKGLGALGITETSVKYKTEEEKQRDKEKLKELKEKEAKAKKDAAKAAKSGSPAKMAKPEPVEETDEMKRRRMIYSKIKQLNMEEGNDF